MAQGATVICENISEIIDPAVNAIINKEILEIQGDKYIKFNDEQVEYDENFRFFMITNQNNPHFTPEI